MNGSLRFKKKSEFIYKNRGKVGDGKQVVHPDVSRVPPRVGPRSVGSKFRHGSTSGRTNGIRQMVEGTEDKKVDILYLSLYMEYYNNYLYVTLFNYIYSGNLIIDFISFVVFSRIRKVNTSLVCGKTP